VVPKAATVATLRDSSAAAWPASRVQSTDPFAPNGVVNAALAPQSLCRA
jgi:hypothetical protein